MIIKIIVTGFLFGFGIKFGYWAFCTLHDIIYGIVLEVESIEDTDECWCCRVNLKGLREI